MRQLANIVGSTVLLAAFGFLFPFAWPAKRLTLTSLLVAVGGAYFVMLTVKWAYQSTNIAGTITAVAIVNWLLVLVWLGVVFAVSGWFNPNPPDRPVS